MTIAKNLRPNAIYFLLTTTQLSREALPLFFNPACRLQSAGETSLRTTRPAFLQTSPPKLQLHPPPEFPLFYCSTVYCLAQRPLISKPTSDYHCEEPIPEPQTNSDLAYADTLWKAADSLRGQVDAAEYKHVVLGLLFLKYISDSFESRRDQLKLDLEKDGIKGKQLES